MNIEQMREFLNEYVKGLDGLFILELTFLLVLGGITLWAAWGTAYFIYSANKAAQQKETSHE